jgi:soluble lytic murein transglycosylase-like protein
MTKGIESLFARINRKVVLCLVLTVSACQSQSDGSSTFLLAGKSVEPVEAYIEDTAETAFQYASLTRIPTPGSRPYAREHYSDDIELDIVPNPKIDAVTGREVSLLPRRERRRQASLPFAERSVLYNSIIKRHARANGIDYELARAVIYSESSFRVNAKGRHGEVGLMQVKPSTARALGYRGTVNQLYIPENNIKYGMKYLRKAKSLGDGTICGTILKYNAGLYSRRMNPVSARYCQKVKRLMRQVRGGVISG